MFINIYKHDISIFVLNCNKISLSIKLHVSSICANECFCMMQTFFVHLNKNFEIWICNNVSWIYVVYYFFVNQMLI
jgi:hypothetical protein